MFKPLLFGLIAGLGMIASLWFVAPICGAYNYTVAGMLCGLTISILATRALCDLFPIALAAVLGTVIGTVMGAIWPATLAILVLECVWAAFSDDEPGGPARGSAQAA